MQMGQVVTLSPGQASSDPTGTDRRDWSPFAQPPDPVSGIMAHTPNPNAYIVGNGRTMLPRATRNYGSRGFVAKAGVINIDPTDPGKGTGGITVDLERINKQTMSKAASMAPDNPHLMYAIASGQHVEQAAAVRPNTPQPRQAPPGESGYVVPEATWGGKQVVPQAAEPQQMHAMSPIPDPGNINMPGVQTFENPSVKRPGGQVIPQTVDDPSTAQQPSQGQPQPYPSTMQAPQPQAPPMPQQQPPQQQPPQQSYPPQQGYPQAPLPNGYPAQPYPLHYQQPPPPPAPAPGPDPTQQAMLETLKQLTSAVADLRRQPPRGMSPDQIETEKQALERAREQTTHELYREKQERQGAVENEGRDNIEDALAVPEDTGLDFLTDPPSKPRVQVVFDLGAGGRHLKRFHHVAALGNCLSLFYDSRYEGDQFTPAPTGENQPPILLSFPQDGNRTVRCIVPDNFNQRLGCIDILNFIIVTGDEQASFTQPTMEAAAPDLSQHSILSQGEQISY